MKNNIFNIVRIYLPLAAAISAMSGLVYLAVQQDYRQSANDPQIQIAEDFAGQLAAGRPMGQIDQNSQLNIAKSLAPYILFYDEQGKFITGSGQLNGQPPTLPAGVFDTARQAGEDRITWQPQDDVRSALVVVHVSGQQSGFVAAGRSLREVEQREWKLLWYVFGAWLAALVISLLVLIVIEGGWYMLGRREPADTETEDIE